MLFQTLQSGKKVPALGLGTWLSKPGEVVNAVACAVEIGYRHFDTAYVYQNEADLGKGLKKCLDAGLVKREELFITTKLWNPFHHPDEVRKGCETSLQMLGLDYLDLYLVHWPMGYVNNGELFPKDSNGHFMYSDVDYVDTWKAMEKLVDDGLVRHIGLSNFNMKQIQRVWDIATIKPAMLQVECHPYFQQKDLIKFAAEKGIVFTGYAPFGSPDRPWHKETDPRVLDDPLLSKIGKRYGKSAAQVVIRYQLQRGMCVIPKSVTPSRIAENFKVFDFELSVEDMNTIGDLDRGYRTVVLDWLADHPHYPFHA